MKKNRKRVIDKSDDISGAIAQLGERYDGIVEVRSSILLGSTKILKPINRKDIPSLTSFAAEAFQTLNTLFERLEKVGFDPECDGHSLSFELPDGRPYLLNYHGVTQQIWLASPLTGAHHFQLQGNRWVSTRGTAQETEDLISLLEAELAVSLS